ncbi:FAD-binding protein [Amycolatopsis silviterrae]|uniref:FAD-binding protein n=1 Tax=Amycolatopsis silviterrae TaxID=1656914 RepID=A0ABW5HH81_9PSEU
MPEQSFSGLRLEGTLSTDPQEIAYAATDFGGIVSHSPLAVARVGSPRDVSAVLTFAAEHGLSVTPRGQGHTSMGQAQAASAWTVLTRTGFTITATMDGMPLPDLDPDRSSWLRSAWNTRHPGLRQMQFEAEVYQVSAGRQVNIRYPLS